NVVNPTALVLSAVMMLQHLGEFEAASKIEHAVLATLEDGSVRTGDVAGYDKGATTTAYTDAIVSNLGRKAARSRVRTHRAVRLLESPARPDIVTPKSRKVVGVDVFVESARTADELGAHLGQLADGSCFCLKLISNRGTKVYPAMGAITDCVDHWRCRFVSRSAESEVSEEQVLDLVRRVGAHHRWVHLEKLLEFDGKPGFTKDQGED
ncbi:MAG: isocitrate dehydrogenase, partial [Acidobacteriota bacterium]|nr:isocitrate dehydrogenase [Acidobacteriota bacterium]